VGTFADACLIQSTICAVKAVLHRQITVNNTTGKLGYEEVVLAPHAVGLAVAGDIVMIKAGGEAIAAAKLGDRDYISFDPETAAAQ